MEKDAPSVNDFVNDPVLPENKAPDDYDELVERVRQFVQDKGLHEYEDVLIRGAVLATYGDEALDIAQVTEKERAVLLHEQKNRWAQPWTMYALAICNSIAAAVQYVEL